MHKGILSNKDRMQRKVAEAAAGIIAKAEKKKVVTRKKVADLTVLSKIVWKVFDSGYKEIACFPFSEEAEAVAQADALTKKKNKCHFVNKVKVPIE